ncbi:hypothetical protein SAMN05519103_02758 [Rhizobiales bacterium GAS113]|nr:hypothetical protein SAMN05519103_02758 [Rhizobiales bacterium GAS113]
MSAAGKTILILGGTSDIGRATALRYAQDGWRVRLAGRDPAGLRREADDIAARSAAEVTTYPLDILDAGAFTAFADALPELPDTVLCVIGQLGDQKRAQSDIEHAAEIMRSNFEGPALLLGLFAERFVARESGMIIGVGSVAGDRGRASNYVYGAAKAGFGAFLSGLRNRLAGAGIHVLTVKPGFVRTRMTEGLKLPPPLTATPQEVADAIFRAATRRRNAIYVKGRWRAIMTVIGLIPEPIFKKLKL